MTSPTPLQLDRQIDHEFFHGAAPTHSNHEDISSALSNLSLGEGLDSAPSSDANGLKDNRFLEFSEAFKIEASIEEPQNDKLFEMAKGPSAKEVQWSAFNVSSQQFAQVEFESDSFSGGESGKLVTSQAFCDFNSKLIENKVDKEDVQPSSSVTEHSADLTAIQYWENLYPGWKYDSFTGQWYQLDGFVAATSTQSSFSEAKSQNSFEQSLLGRADTANCHLSTHSALESISEESTALNSWNQASQGSINYPHNMLFDPQYPDWYYDTITQSWYTLDSYNQVRDTSNASEGQQTNHDNVVSGSKIDASTDQVHEHHSQNIYGSSYGSDFGKQNIWPQQNGQEVYLNASSSGYGLQNPWKEQANKKNNWQPSGSGYDEQKKLQPEMFFKNGDVVASFSDDRMVQSNNASLDYIGSQPDKLSYSNNLEPSFEHNYAGSVMTVPQSSACEIMNQFSLNNMERSLPTHLYSSNHGTESYINYTQPSFYGANPFQSQFSYTSNGGRLTAGRPPHALVTFGFGGKVLVMKDVNISSSLFGLGNQGTVGGVVLIHSLMDVVMDKTNFLDTSIMGDFGYFHTLCQQSFPGPLVGGNASSKDVNKWMDDRINGTGSTSMDFQNGSPLWLLLSLLKVLCQHYGKLRSPYGIDPSHTGSDSPELAVSNLFSSAKRKDTPFGGFCSSMHCLKHLPSEGELRATANKVQNLMLFGSKKEALQCAQEGQLWGLALVLAAHFGEQFYSDVVKQMALRQFVCGSPLRTLCLLISGHPADVFSSDSSSDLTIEHYHSSQVIPNTMLDHWQENLAIITSNRTKDDELVIIHLGDCLWKERGEVTAAHTCYLVAEANIEQYSDSSRLCLIGVDHMKNPRTYACPDAIQMTEVYEYSKTIRNSQFVLLPFQPYKLVYAHMLAEVGRVSDSLRYCQASMRILKNSGRSPDLELLRTLFSSLEERLRTCQQGGYGTNFAPTKLVNKFLDSIDRSIHRMIGPSPLPSMQQNSGDGVDNNSLFQKVSNSQSTMAITSLMPAPSVEDMSEWTVDSRKKVTPNRSVSEPNFGRSVTQGNAPMSDGRSRFGWLGSHLLQKTVGWMTWSRHDHQAKLGDRNKFYYDVKLKRWVEEGAELPSAEVSLPPPPTDNLFQKGISDYDVKNALTSNNLSTDAHPGPKLDASSGQGFGFPPVPPNQNQFSAHSRIGVRSRYVDTFNKGSGSFTSSFRPLSASNVNPLAAATFVPSAPTNFNESINSATANGPSTVHENLPTAIPSSMENTALWTRPYAAVSNAKEAVCEEALDEVEL